MKKKYGQTWFIPKPEKKSDGEIQWFPIVRVGRHIPFGYKQSEEDPDLLLPIPEELEAFEKAKLFLQEYSLRQVAAWLSKETGRYISHVGLQKRVAIEKSRRQQAENYRTYARRYKEAAEKAERLANILSGENTVIFPDNFSFRKDDDSSSDS